MTITAVDTPSLTAEATAVLAAMPGVPYETYLAEAPDLPGVVAVAADDAALARLDVTAPHGGLIAVAAAAHGLLARDVRAAFQSGRTGVSPLRQALAALLVEDLALDVERTSPGSAGEGFTLTPESEDVLTEWMRAHLTLRGWAAPEGADATELAVQASAELAPALVGEGAPASSARVAELVAEMHATARRSATL